MRNKKSLKNKKEEFVCESLKDLQCWVFKWVKELKKENLLLLLYGSMGVGKTQFVRFLVEALASKEQKEIIGNVCSPSFTLYNIYQVDQFYVAHVDLYRLKVEEELESIGFWDLFQNKYDIVIVEWPERLHESILPLHWTLTKITMEFVEEEKEMNGIKSGRAKKENLSNEQALKSFDVEKRKVCVQSFSSPKEMRKNQ